MEWIARARRVAQSMVWLAIVSLTSAPFGCSLPSANAAEPTAATVALADLDAGCGNGRQVADAGTGMTSLPAVAPTSSPVGTTPLPSASPTLVPLFQPATGPGTLVAPVAPTPVGVTPPPLPTPTPTSANLNRPLIVTRATPGATEHPMVGASPTPLPTLGPNQIAILADSVTGSTKAGVPGDAQGDVHVFYSQGVLIGDRAHYDGDQYITVSGHTHLINNAEDTRLDADTIVFDIRQNRAVLTNGHGETSRGVEKGELYYTAQHLRATANGTTHGTAATFTTCENPRGGYHMYARTMDVTPGQRMVARHVLVFLGGVAILYVPFLVIPLNRSDGQRHPVAFAPEVGYNQQQGAYVRLRLGFGTRNNYYGYYRIEEYSKAGLGLGYVAFIGIRNNQPKTSVNAYTLQGSNGTGRQNNLSIQDNETFTKNTRGQFSLSYTGDYGPYVDLPAQDSLSGTVTHATSKATQTYTFSRYTVGSQESNLNTAFQDTRQISAYVTQGLQLSYTETTNNYSGSSDQTSSFHINTLTHVSSHIADYDFTIDQTDATTPSGYNKVPELVIRPHTGRSNIPFNTQLTLGQYTEPRTTGNFSTSRALLDTNIGPALFKVFHSSDFSATLGASQYAYGTGDLKAQTRQNMSLTTPFSRHINNVLSYTEQNTAGPLGEPFYYLDTLGGAAHNAQDVLRIYNADIYTLSLSTSTGFDRQAQPIGYQLTSHPSTRSTVIVAGNYVPGAGNGFFLTNVQIATPIGRGQMIEFTTNVNWKTGERFMNKNIYFRKVIGNCYDITTAYNEDLKAVNVTLDLLSFPNRSANFTFASQQQAIFPQSLVP